MNKVIPIILLLSSISISSYANGTITSNVQSSATLNAACELSINNVNFGDIIASTNAIEVQQNIVFSRCSKSIPYTIGISAGNSGNHLSRHMIGNSDSANKLNYKIAYKNGPSSYIWGTGSLASAHKIKNIPSFGNNGEIISHLAYITIFPNQYVKPDVYTDALIVSINY